MQKLVVCSENFYMIMIVMMMITTILTIIIRRFAAHGELDTCILTCCT